MFKEFKLSDLFTNFIVGKQPDESNRFDCFKKDMLPVVTGVTVNNGKGFYSYKTNQVSYKEIITISKDGEYAGTPFYQPNDVILGGHSLGCISNKLNLYTSLYIMTELSVYQKEGFWKQGGVMGSVPLNRLVDVKITLPVKVLADTEPDWEYMENYIKEIEKKSILLVKEENEQNISLLKELVGSDNGSDISDAVEFKEFEVTSLFENVSRGSRLKTSDRVDGNIPLITAGEEKQGIACYIDFNKELFTKNSLTIDMFGNCFYRGYSYFADDNILSFHNRKLNRKHLMYIKSCLSYLPKKYNYSKQFRMKELEDFKIKLPVNKQVSDLVPDWSTIEEYMQFIQQKYITLKQQENTTELNNLLLVTGLTEQALTLDDEQAVLDCLLETLISWSYMERVIAKIELNLRLSIQEKIA